MPYANVMAAIAANDEAAALAAIAALDPAAEPRPADSPLLQALYRGMERVPAALVARGYAPDLIEAAAMGDAAGAPQALTRAETRDRRNRETASARPGEIPAR